MNLSETLRTPLDEVEKLFVSRRNFAYQVDKLDHEMKHIISAKRQRDILSAKEGDVAFLGHSRIFRDYGILESDAYALLISKYGLSPSHYSWTDKSEYDSSNIYNQAIHANTKEPNMVYLFEYTFSRIDNSWSGIRIATRRMNDLFQNYLKNPLFHPRDSELQLSFTQHRFDQGETVRVPLPL